MKRSLAVILVFAVFGGVALGAETAKSSADLCKGVVDPYDTVAQKSLFFKAAGKDNELSEKEFEADKATGKGFVASFEKWSTIVAFDKDGKKQIDWLEADAYRRDLRRRVLGAHDASKDGKLAGDERTAANKALAAGKFATVSRRRSSSRGRGGSPWERPEIIKQYDKNKDGKLDEKEQEAAREAFRARMDLRRYDTNRDGKLDEKETAERDRRRKEFYDRFDKNKNGKIDEDERGAIGEYYRNRRYDTNNDGKLDEKEIAARDKANAEREQTRKEMYAKFDKNKNGRIDEDERSGIGDWFRMRRYDTNKDGKLDKEETAARDKAEAEREKERAERRKQFDKDGDGKLNEEEERAYRNSFRRRRGRGRGGR
ncbi:MAG: hypothetical protein QGH60_08985 [Phycisphaerae bacterium]|jgi:hypothetical protein|nr:hypothetical protein [Phycisphaerae bacterium]